MGTRMKTSSRPMGSGQSQQYPVGTAPCPQHPVRNGQQPSYDRMQRTQREFPDTLEGFGYAFNERGELRHIDTNQPFTYYADAKDNAYNERRYKVIGELVTRYIYMLLEKETRLLRTFIPVITKVSKSIVQKYPL
ncbi:hypothetical protein NP493_351g01019 [Ridgeia piscesae]|uniref:Arb2 domain-containing protein n=1 Tax=Ridgeia piscesae TaxID=27915 RepID=A0AAD9L3M2_RIDPI|nr:hypothetical protein NP493_351g01019 [Ridgeia piscesae]